MKVKKRNKRSRIRGRRTCGFSAKLHKGSGSHGGHGMAGSGKRADQKKTYVLKYLYPYFGKTRKLKPKKKPEAINLDDIDRNIEKFVKKGMAKETSEGFELNLENFKILGGAEKKEKGEIKRKMIIKAKAASKSAIQSV